MTLKLQLLIILILTFVFNVDKSYSQFRPYFKINQYSNPMISLNKSSKLYIGIISSNDTVLIRENVFFPKGNKDPRRKSESYFAIFDKDDKLVNTLHFYGDKSLKITGSYNDNNDNYYFALRGADTIYHDNQLFTNPFIDSATAVYIFHYNGASKKLNLCQVV
ncbi:MAG: hypothetical protein M3Q56_09650 [Bacteroidota bacterium]|nr:hypothetical protein [Bacteroidota bacterium]